MTGIVARPGYKVLSLSAAEIIEVFQVCTPAPEARRRIRDTPFGQQFEASQLQSPCLHRLRWCLHNGLAPDGWLRRELTPMATARFRRRISSRLSGKTLTWR